MKKRFYYLSLFLSAAILYPSEVLAWCEPLNMTHNIAEYNCNSGAVDLYWISNDSSPEQKRPGASCSVDVCCATFCGSKGGRARAKSPVDSSESGKRYLIVSVSGSGDWSGVSISGISAPSGYVQTTHVEHDDPGTVAWNYKTQLRIAQTYQGPAGSGLTSPGDVWYDQNTANIVVTAPNLLVNGTNFVAVGWTSGSGNITAAGDGNSVTIASINQPSSITWTYRPAFTVTLGVTGSGITAAQADLQPHNGALMTRADLEFVTSVKFSIPSGNDRFRAIGWTNGFGDFPLSGAGQIASSIAGDRLELRLPVSGATSLKSASGLTWVYIPERRLDIIIDPSLPENVRTLIASASPGPSPTAGVHWTSVGQSIPAFTPQRVVDGSQGATYVNIGYSGTGSVTPTTGAVNNVTFNNNAFSTIQWKYKRAYSMTTSFILEDGSPAPAFVTGNPSNFPANGASDVIVGNSYVFTTPSIINAPQDGVRYVCVGWNGTGDVPANGNTNAISGVSVTQNSSITWVFRRQNRLQIQVSPPSASATSDAQPAAGDNWYNHNVTVNPSAKLDILINGTNTTCLGSSVLLGGVAAQSSVEQIVGSGANARYQRTFLLDEPATILWLYVETELWTVGQPIVAPAGANPQLQPVIDLVLPAQAGDTVQNTFGWFGPSGSRALYPTRPVSSAKLTWQNANPTGQPIIVGGFAQFPAQLQAHVGGVPVNLAPPPFAQQFVDVRFTSGNATVVDKIFRADYGMSVLLFTQGANPDPLNNPVLFEIVETTDIRNSPDKLTYVNWTIGETITNELHQSRLNQNGFVFYSNAFYDASAYSRNTRLGPIIPVNTDTPADEDDMVVAWYQPGLTVTNIGWPKFPYHYTCTWPDDGVVDRVYIASQIGTGPLAPALYPQAQVYVQSNPDLPGYNPNEEHAAMFDIGGSPAAFALRNDLNASLGDSLPYILVKYLHPLKQEWAMKVYKVETVGGGYTFDYPKLAGQPLLPPYPLSVLPQSMLSIIKSGHIWYHRDHKSGHWAKAAGLDGATSEIVMHWYYILQPGWYFPDFNSDGSPDAAVGDPIPWLNGGLNTSSPPVDVTYVIDWPTNNVAILSPGETLTQPKKGLPAVFSMAAAEVIFDENLLRGDGPLVKLMDVLNERWVPLASVPDSVKTENRLGRLYFPELPPHLNRRLSYDPISQRLNFGGVLDTSGVGEPLLLLNIMSFAEKDLLQAYAPDWAAQIGQLFDKTRNPQDIEYGIATIFNPLDSSQGYTPENWIDLWGIQVGLSQTTNGQPKLRRLLAGPKALSAGAATGLGWVTLVENDDPSLGAAPVALHVFRVDGEPYRGEIKVILSDNIFDEKITLRHSGDFGGEPERMTFEWYYQPDSTGFAPDLPPNVPPGTPLPDWTFFIQGQGLQEITIEGATPLTLSDNWFATRYGYEDAFPFITNNYFVSQWAGAPGGEKAQLAVGWIKRVIAGLNPFDARVRDFHASAVNTIVSMLTQAGQRYEGAIAFSGDPCNLNQLGLIEAYDTVLRRGKLLSVDAGINYGPANSALLNISTRLSDLYMLLANEAYQDALDPTIGFGTDSGEYGTLAPSIFAFQNQVSSLLDEELVLLRGRDASAGPTRAAPVYNRFFWNFTQGEGEVAYVQAYNISDQVNKDSNNDGCIDATDGFLNEDDAKTMYPQGHGDAWGHYLSAVKYHYNLLANPNFTWEPRPEAVLVGGAAITVDYLDERKFTRAAAAKAKVGAEIVDLTYRSAFVDDPSGQWQGYKDTDRDRAWGFDDWARRAGMGAYFDWAVANAILPSIDPNTNHTGIAKIDRTTVPELMEIAVQFQDIQTKADQADRGLNPLGLAKGVVPFDIDPGLLQPIFGSPKTHFEQIYDRALESLKNAVAVFDYANQLTRMLRQNQDQQEKFSINIAQQERDYMNRLIEIFGYPYADDIGPNGTYPSGYNGPDWIHFMYVDPSELTGEPIESVTSYDVTYNFSPTATNDAGLGVFEDEYSVEFTFSADGKWLVKPPSWTSQRRAPGEMQRTISDLIIAKANFDKAIKEYDYLIGCIEAEKTLLETQFAVDAQEVVIRNRVNNELTTLDDTIRTLVNAQLGLRRVAESSDRIFEAIIEGIPKVAGIAAADVTAPARAALFGTRAGISIALNSIADGLEGAQLDAELDKDAVERGAEIEFLGFSSNLDYQSRLLDLQGYAEQAVIKRMEMSTLLEVIQQSAGRFNEVLARGERMLEERAVFRRTTAPQIQDLRYQDMAFRIFRNDALQKYRAQFDLAARYVYLAATAYDYETNLLGGDNGAGRQFLTDIVRQRSLGQLIGELPIPGRPGLADPLGRLGQNFAVYKTQMGFNNPQTETSRFSLRTELFRIKTNSTSDVNWRNTLEKFRVADLWAIPEFQRYCRPFAPRDAGPQPGLVIPFRTYIQYGRNFFGWPLSGGDSTYDPTFFATKIRSVGIWFQNYNGAGLSFTPRVYLVPAGLDVLRSPSGDTLATREWKVIDQKIPAPFPIGNSDLQKPDWIPMNDSLSDFFSGIRQFSRIRAYHDSGFFTPTEMTSDSRLIGRSVWNTEWLLIIPGETLLNPAGDGLDTFISGLPVPGGGGARDGNGIKDIKLFFQTYAYSGN